MTNKQNVELPVPRKPCQLGHVSLTVCLFKQTYNDDLKTLETWNSAWRFLFIVGKSSEIKILDNTSTKIVHL